MSTTRELAKQLGLIEIMSKYENPFEYLCVLDFEATCWDKEDRRNHPPAEIIEFACVLYHIGSGLIQSEYQQYVMPTEHTKLSKFCMELTGIKQPQVDNGVPIQTCLMLFHQWLTKEMIRLDFNFDAVCGKQCAFATWTDWDLGTCLHHELLRKRITKAKIFRQWIDVKKLYRDEFDKTPKGLKAALTDFGMEFVGSEHCGLTDARNTAYLIRKMLTQGLELKITSRK